MENMEKSGIESIQNLYEVRKTVKFGLQTLEKLDCKNDNYNKIVNLLQNNEYIKDQVNKFSERFNNSSNEKEWSIFVEKTKEKLGKIDKYLIQFISILDKIQKIDKEYIFQIQINLKNIKSKGGFGKGLYHSFNKKDTNKKVEKVLLFQKPEYFEELKKFFENSLERFKECNSSIKVYYLFIKLRIDYINENLNELNNLLVNPNHNKERLSEIYKILNYISNNIKILNDYFFGTFIFAGGLREQLSEIKGNIELHSIEKLEIEKIIGDLLEDFKNPNNGCEIGKATLHYYTLNKKSIFYTELDYYKILLGDDRNDNKLSKIAYKILEKLKQEKNNIEAKESLIEKVIYTNEICQKIANENNMLGKVSIGDIVNCLNNKNQTYDNFINKKQSFDDLGMKQKLRFALTTLVDSDIYSKGKFHNYCLTNRDNAEKVLKDFGFNYYKEYKKLTEDINNNINLNQSKKERGNLFTKSGVYKNAFEINKIVSGLKGALKQNISFLENEKLDQEKLQFYGVLGIHNNEKILFLAPKEKSKSFYKYIGNTENQKGASFIYLYNSISTKSLEKLFNQIYSLDHPFSYTKKEIFNNKDLDSIDKLKFKDLSIIEVKNLFISENNGDISKYENWKEKFKKIYTEINSCNDIKSLLELIEKKGIYFEKVAINIDEIKSKFPDAIISKVKNGTEKDLKNIHLEYFEKAISKMEKGIDIKEKLNPEILISYVPQASNIDKDDVINFYKNKTYSKEGAGFNQEFIEKNHRYWRENINVGFTVEFDLPVKESSEKNFRVIGMDRGEKKLATLCNLEYKDNIVSILPIEYYENNLLKYSYFLDLANFKVGILNGKKVILRIFNEDNNINLKKYEYLVRLQKTLWFKENKDKLESMLEKHENIDESMISKIEELLMNIHGLGVYRDKIFDDKLFINKVIDLIISWKNFDINLIPHDEDEKNTWFEKKLNTEVNKIKMRENISANISGVINYLYGKNKEEGFETYVSMENLHNSNWNNKVVIDKTDGKKRINNDFTEYRHNLLSGTTIYNKIEQSILNKLQVYKTENNLYENRSIKGQKTSYFKTIQNELKYISKSENKIEFEDLYGILFEGKSKLSPSKSYGSIIFVDPYYTSKKCPKCGVFGKEGKKDIVTGHERNDDIITCTKCGFKSDKHIEQENKKISFSEIYKTVGTGDENGALQIGFRGLEYINSITQKLP